MAEVTAIRSEASNGVSQESTKGSKTLVVVESGVRNTNDLLKLTLAAVDDAIRGEITVPLANVVVKGVNTAAKLIDLNARYGKPDKAGNKCLSVSN